MVASKLNPFQKSGLQVWRNMPLIPESMLQRNLSTKESAM
ncbi:hypothetical protein M2359_003441 [Gordonia amarae]|nr:hypothetical protein [Gordonia amarae]